jgi:catechol 2,3-dioxygenase-like lactoylglutathione lyase family enzyme
VTKSGLRILGVYETVLYAPDPPTAAAFYRDTLGLVQLEEPDDLSAVFRLPDGGVLLIFNPQKSSQPGRPVPSHGAAGPGHLAFALEAGAYQGALGALRDAGVAIERETEWERGRSVYVRDPAGNSVELVDGDIWPPSAARN